jgi:hypothetical protein
MKHSYQNEGIASGDVISCNKELLEFSGKGFIKYNLFIMQQSRFKDEVKERNVMVEFFRNEESEQLDNIKPGDNVVVWFRIESREHNNKFYTTAKGSHVVVLIAKKVPEKNIEQPAQPKQQVLDGISTEEDEDVPF